MSIRWDERLIKVEDLHVSVCLCVQELVEARGWYINISQNNLVLRLRQGLFLEPGVGHLGQAGWPVSPGDLLASASLFLGYRCSWWCSAFLCVEVGAGDPNSSPYACMSCSSPKGPSPRSHMFLSMRSSYIVQTGLELGSSWFSLPNVRSTGVCRHTGSKWVLLTTTTKAFVVFCMYF